MPPSINSRTALIALCFIAVNAKAEPTVVDAFARPALLGMQLSARHGASEGSLSKSQFECVQALSPHDFHQATEEVINASLTPSERISADRFFATKVGQKYVKHGLHQLYSAVGEQPPEPPPHFSDAEYRELEQFAATPAGQKFTTGQVMQSSFAKLKYGGRIRELMEQCKAK